MPPNATTESDPIWLDTLLTLPDEATQLDYLQQRICTDDDLRQLLVTASEAVERDPAQAAQLAGLCLILATTTPFPPLVPEAEYLLARLAAIRSEFDEARERILRARTQYQNQGRILEALRTNIGLMNVLAEAGRYDEALTAGQYVLDTLIELDPATPEDQLDHQMLPALARQNMGMCYWHMGRYQAALDAYATAEATYEHLNMPDRRLDISINRGLILMHTGHIRAARDLFQTAAHLGQQTQQPLLAAQSLSNLGEALLILGEYTASLATLEQARIRFTELKALADGYITQRKIGDAYLALNLYTEALSAYQQAAQGLQEAGMVHHHAWALWGQGSTLLALTRYDEAAPVLVAAAEAFEAAGNRALHSAVLLEESALLAAQNDPRQAQSRATAALQLVQAANSPVPAFYAHLRLADLATDAMQVQGYLEQARLLADSLALPQLRYRLNQRLGDFHRQQGQVQAAEICLREAIKDIEQLRGNLAQEAIRSSFLQDKTSAYGQLVRLYTRQNTVSGIRQALTVVEQAKSRALLDLLAGIEHSADNNISPIENLHLELAGIYNELLNPQAGRLANPAVLYERARNLESEISTLQLQQMAQTERADPFRQPSTPEQIQTAVEANEALLIYYLIDGDLLIFVLRRDQLYLVQQPDVRAQLQTHLQHLQAQLSRFQAGTDFVQRHQSVLLQSMQRILQNLYHLLLKPVEALLPPGGKLSIVPHELLHQIPFQALHNGQDDVLAHYEVRYAPSASLWLASRNQQPFQPDGPALVLGIADEGIPHVADEVAQVGRQFPQAQVYLNQNATLKTLQSETPPTLVHLACHGMFRADNPMFSALKLHDGWLTATDAMKLKLPNALVTLSACESGRNSVLGGDELLGLTRAFLAAGAASLVVSQWLVQDESTSMLMADWYARLRQGQDPAAALRAAQRQLQQSHPHPFYWAPFVLIGR